MFKKKKKKSEETVEVVEVSVVEDEQLEITKDDIIDFADFTPEQDKQLEESVISDEVVDLDTPVEPDSKNLNDYFKEHEEDTKKLKKEKKKPKKVSKRQKKKERDLQDVKDRKLYKYKNKKYTKVEDFIKYLNDHYLDIDEIAKELLEDENFYGWISKNSGVFEQSLEEFKKIKEKIEK